MDAFYGKRFDLKLPEEATFQEVNKCTIHFSGRTGFQLSRNSLKPQVSTDSDKWN